MSSFGTNILCWYLFGLLALLALRLFMLRLAREPSVQHFTANSVLAWLRREHVIAMCVSIGLIRSLRGECLAAPRVVTTPSVIVYSVTR